MKHKQEEQTDNIDYDRHGWSEETNTVFTCNFCKEKFEGKRYLMKHIKQKHAENVSTCWKFANGHCDLGD